MNEYRIAKGILDDAELAEQAHVRDLMKQCDWRDPFDRAFHLSSRRADDRNRLVRKLAPKNVCPSCGSVVLSGRSWVVSKDEKSICCRSCYITGFDVPEGETRIKRKIFGAYCPRFEIDGFQLAAIRDELGVKSSTFARKAGWSNVYQFKLENSVQSVTLEVAETIIQVLDELKCTTDDCL